jgi:antitoxin ParD1/3/4
MTRISILCYCRGVAKGTTTGGGLMNVSLTPDLEHFVHSKVKSGRYTSASEVIREALRVLEDHEQARGAQLAEFNRELGRRLASLDAGRHVTASAVRGRLRRKSEDRRRKRG